MNSKELTSLAIRVFAIYVLVQAIILIAQSGASFQTYFQGDQKWLFLIPLFSILGLITAFFILWKISNKVIENLVKPEKELDDFKVDQIFILHLIGFYLIVVGLLGLGQGGISLFYVYFYQANEFGPTYRPEISSQTMYYIIANIIKVGFGIALIIKPNGWVKLFNWFRRLGLSKK
jgi:hypothetical protein